MRDLTLPTGAVTLLMTDLEGSTKLWEADEALAAIVLARHHALLDAAISLHGGIRPEEQGEGDSIVAAFVGATDAVAAALDIQIAFAQERWPGDAAPRVRIAVHTGEVSLRDPRNYQGPTIIRCARLRSAAHGGQAVLSGTTRELVLEGLPDNAALRDLGEHRLKDLGRAERVWQICHPDVENEFPPLRTLDSHPNNLPVQLTNLVGRADAVQTLADIVASERLVTLTGAGGSGKTRLALQVAADVADRYDGAWWVELASVREDERVASAVAAALGFHETHEKATVETLVEELRDRATLLVLDNCEQVIDGVAQVLHALLTDVPDLRVVTTSREPIGITGEVSWRVPSLDGAAAVELFVDRAVRARGSFAPDVEQLDAIERICRRLDGLPLGIELAAARTRLMHPNRIADALDDRFRLLTGGSRTAMPRQRTLEASVAWSHDLLDELERAVFRRLAVFEGGFTLEAAEAVVADSETVDAFAVLDGLGRLVDKSLVQLDTDGAETRYRLLETIRQYARERLVDAHESDSTRERHFGFFSSLAQTAAPALMSGAGLEWLARLETDHDNVRVALEWAATTGDADRLPAFVTALTLFWELRGHLPEAQRWFARALSMSPAPSTTRARALWGAAHVALYDDDFDGSAELAAAALELAEQTGDVWTTARALNTVGYGAVWTDPTETRRRLTTSIELGRAIGDDWAVADGLKMMTIAWLVQDDHAQLERAVAELEREAQRLDNQFFIAWCHACNGFSALRQGRFEVSRLEFDRSLELCRLVGDPATAGLVVAWLADLEAATGALAAASRRVDDFIAHATATGGHMGLGPAVIARTTLLLGGGDADGARAFAAALSGYFSVPILRVWALTLQAAAAIETGALDEARTALERAQPELQRLDSAWLTAFHDHQVGALHRAEGELVGAEHRHHAALTRRHQAGLVPGVIESLEALGVLALDLESTEEATRLFAAAAAARTHVGLVRWPIAQPAYDAALDCARARLGDDAFTGAWAEGATLSIDDAVAYASRARGDRKRPSSGWASLTPTEERVVALAAEGLTNRQIGERMFVAPGTVKVHLGHVFTKLGVATRAELAGAATKRSLTSGT